MKAFREQHARFAERNAQVVGVSMDEVKTLKRFHKELELPFSLLSDNKGELAKAFGVWGGTYARRVIILFE